VFSERDHTKTADIKEIIISTENTAPTIEEKPFDL